VNHIRSKLSEFLGEKGEQLIAEGEKYSDVNVNGCNYRGGDRSRNIGIFVGKSMCMCFSWFFKFNPIGKTVKLMLNDGDAYIMSWKTTGFDSKRSSILTLKHSLGEKFIKYEKKEKKDKKEKK
jgi:hypothetical protein